MQMTATLLVAVMYYDNNDNEVIIKAGTPVLIEGKVACHNGNHFPISQDEYRLATII